MTALDGAGSVLGPRYRWISIGMCALVFLSAFESLAVTTVMPTISTALDGASLYALAFAGPLAVSVIGMVVAGNWSDRRGPLWPLILSVALFVVGLTVAGFAGDMPTLVAGRLLHGLGGGALTVALYVIVGKLYPPALHPRIFAGFAAAWVVPSLVGPFVGGLVAERLGWTWVFHGVILLVAPALAMIWPALRSLRADTTRAAVPWTPGRLAWAVVVAAGVLTVNLAAEVGGAARWLVTGTAAAVAAVALRPLLPAGTLRARRGLPTVVLLRALVSGAFFGAEVYLPYLLTDTYRLTPTLAGMALTVGGLTWAAASQVQGRLTVPDPVVLRLGTVLLVIAVAASLLTTLLALPAAVAIAGWGFAGAGMGLMYPRMSTMTLAFSTARDRGFNSSAIAIADSTGAALALAGTGIVFAAFAPVGPTASFAACFTLALVFALAAAAVRGRVAHGAPVRRGVRVG